MERWLQQRFVHCIFIHEKCIHGKTRKNSWINKCLCVCVCVYIYIYIFFFKCVYSKKYKHKFVQCVISGNIIFVLQLIYSFKMLSYTCYYIRFMRANIFWGKVQKQNPSFNSWSALCCQLSLLAATCHSLHLLFLCLLNSLHLSSFAVSRKQTRNLKYRLRYTGLTFIDRPCSMHQIPDILTRCPEPLGIHHQSLCCLHLGLLLCCRACYRTICRPNVHTSLARLHTVLYDIAAHFLNVSDCK